MYQEIESKGLTMGSIFKLSIIGYTFSFGLFILVSGILSLISGDGSFRIGNKPISGITGFISLIFAIPLLVLVFGGINAFLLSSGNWIYCLIKPLRLVFKPIKKTNPKASLEY